MKKKYNYYKLDVGFFPQVIKLCFDDKVFQQILKDHNITLKANALEIGVAETHMVGDGKEAIIVLVFDMSLIAEENTAELVDTIAHEVSHTVDHLAEHIGEEDGFKGETRAYLTGHLATQIFKICMHEKEKYARKTSRKILNKAGERKRGPELQMDQLSVGGAGSHSVAELESLIRRAQNHDGSALTKADPNI